jgi:hypothetical protein
LQALQDSPRFHKVHSTNDLPAAIVTLCAEDGRLAEPGQKWNATDAIMDPTLAGKRLIWAAIGGPYYIVHYERGGIAHTFHVLVAKLTKNDAKPKVVWRAVEVRSKITQHFSMHCEAGSWMTIWIT